MKKKSILLISSTICAASFVVGALVAPKQVGVSADWSAVGINATYTIGDSLQIPDRQFEIGGQSVKATTVVKLPDGTATRNTQLALDTPGLYTVIYTATIGGKTYYTEYEFTVFDEIIRVSSDDSSFKYGLHDSANSSKYQNAKNTEGLLVSLAQGDSISFAPLIDLTNASSVEPIVELFVTPTKMGEYDFEEVEFMLTDVENPNSYIKVTARRSEEGTTATYCLAGGNGQDLTGFEPAWNRLHINNQWGRPVSHGFNGINWCEAIEGNSEGADLAKLSLSYNAATRAIFVNGDQIIDLDNPDYFSELWGGFHSGKVRLSINGDLYTKSNACFCITSVQGVDLAGGTMIDEKAPVITVDTKYAVAPQAAIGASYPVPKATANDDYSGNVAVKTSVWYNYTSSTGALTVPIDENGRFDVTRQGKYSIVYTARDEAGNVAEKVIDVESLASLPQIQLDVDYTGVAYAGEAGERLGIPKAVASNGSGDIEIQLIAELNGEKTVITGEYFKPASVGTYKINVVATDYVGRSVSEEYEVVVTASTKPIFDSDPVLPKYIISGRTYTLDPFYADDYRSGEHESVLTTLYYTDEVVTDKKVEAGGSFTPLVTTNGAKIKLKFKVEGTTAVLEKEVYTVYGNKDNDITNNLQMTNFFVGDGVELSQQSQSIRVIANKANASWEFANKLVGEGLKFQFTADPSSSNFAAIKFTLTDGLDDNVAVEFCIYRDATNNGAYMLDENGLRTAVLSSFAQGANNAFTVVYEGLFAKVGTTAVRIPKTISGEEFTGFPSGYAYLKVGFVEAVAGQALYDIVSVNGHNMVKINYDQGKPTVSLIGEYGDGEAQGKYVLLPSAVVADTVEPISYCTLTVKDPNGAIVTGYYNGQSIALNKVDPSVRYQIWTSIIGDYSVSFEAADATHKYKNTTTYTYKLKVEDRNAPTIAFDAQFQDEISLGQTIIVPQFTVGDDTKLLRSDIYVTTQGGVVYTLQSTKLSSTSQDGLGGVGFKPMYRGNYTVKVIVTDSNNNQTTALIVVKVV